MLATDVAAAAPVMGRPPVTRVDAPDRDGEASLRTRKGTSPTSIRPPSLTGIRQAPTEKAKG
ncbi:hypothetical protein GCM10017788_42630 [Amycolatopsis acidiphila]|nr:hypothetical protein GCM10017788_42630 [Amycolatopsis acidiphila]